MFQFGHLCGKLLGIINSQVQMCDRKDFRSKAGAWDGRHEGMIGWSFGAAWDSSFSEVPGSQIVELCG